MKSQKVRLASLITLALVLTGAPTAIADTDPFPGVAYQAEIPGTRITSSPGVTQAEWEASATYQSWLTTHCPAGSGMGMGVDLAFTTSRTDDTWYAYCTKTWQPQSISAPSETSTVSSQDTSTASTQETITAPSQETVTAPTPTPTQSSAPTPQAGGIGGYAVVDPRDNHVCGVVVSGSSDPFNNGGYMLQEYMGCPSGARFVFQTFPSESGNVAGWHGPEVILRGSTYSLPGGSTLTNGIVTDSNGRTWHSGTGATITPGRVVTPPPSDTQTVLSDTRTVLSETGTVSVQTQSQVSTSSNTAPTETSTVITPSPIAISPQQSETATSIDDLESLPEVDAEEEISHSIDARVVNNKTRIDVSSAWESTRLSIVATKKGSKKKYTYRFSTDASGNYLFKSSINLKGFTLVLYKGAEELVREIV